MTFSAGMPAEKFFNKCSLSLLKKFTTAKKDVPSAKSLGLESNPSGK